MHTYQVRVRTYLYEDFLIYEIYNLVEAEGQHLIIMALNILKRKTAVLEWLSVN